ncbi:head-tail adaptor protein [Pontibaca methylaminivorans]|uniref:head-tail adaptor protein n=1 Tax=Pontibaca methylaminivorans TaxID=515897 RepID=UPI002FDAD42E
MRRIPDLSRRLVLENAERQPDGAGGHVETWVALGEHWAEVTLRSGRERAEVSMPVSTIAWRITIRASPIGSPSRPRPGQRFRDGARVFAIRAVAEQAVSARYLTCFAEEEEAT